MAFAIGLVIGHDDFQRGIDRLGSGVAKENVIDALGSDAGDPGCKLERRGMTELEVWHVVHLLELPGDGFGDLLAAMPGRAAEQTGCAVEHPVAAGRPIVQALRADQQARVGVEVAIRRKRHPVIGDSVRGVWHR